MKPSTWSGGDNTLQTQSNSRVCGTRQTGCRQAPVPAAGVKNAVRPSQGSEGKMTTSHEGKPSVVGTTASGKFSYELWWKESAQLGKT